MQFVRTFVLACYALLFFSGVPTFAQSEPANSLDDILTGLEVETVYETTFDKPIRIIREDELLEDGTFVREPPEDIDWVLEGPAEVSVKDGRLHMKNDPAGNCVLWNTRQFPESFVAEWDFRHSHPQGTAIFFFAAHPEGGGSIYTQGLPRRGGNFGKYTRGKIFSYHTSYTATDEKGVPRGSTHLKKNVCSKEKGNNTGVNGLSPIDGKTDKPYRIRVAKLGTRIILEVDGQICFDWIDDGDNEVAPFKSGQIGFRQMRHTLEASYGGLKVQSVKLPTDK